MLACASAAEGGAMPAVLELALMCDQWKALPEAGGILEQPVGLLQKMSFCLNAYNAVLSEKNRGSMSLTDWSNNNPAAWRLYSRIEKLRREQ